MQQIRYCSKLNFWRIFGKKINLKEIEITIEFSKVQSHATLIEQFSKAFELSNGDTLNLNIDLNTYSFLYSDHLCLIVSLVHYLRAKGVVVNGNIQNLKKESAQANYASRVEFFNLIGATFDEDFERQDASGRFTEILRFENENALDLHKEIMRILLTNDLNEDMLRVLDYCLWEVIDNTLNHSDTSFNYGIGSGFLCCQYFPKSNEVRLIIVDSAQGIHRALTSHPDSKFKKYNEPEAIENCIVKGVTNSKGMGFGLWATSTLVRENGGTLIIHSGNHSLKCEKETQVIESPKWQGTYTFLRINTDIPVTYGEIFGDDMSQKNNFDDFKDEIFGDLDDLW